MVGAKGIVLTVPLLEEVVVVVVLVPVLLLKLVEPLGRGLACNKAEVSIPLCPVGQNHTSFPLCEGVPDLCSR